MTDVNVFHRDMLDADLSRHFEHDWIVELPNGSTMNFQSEGEACAFQRGFRFALGLDMVTGVARVDPNAEPIGCPFCMSDDITFVNTLQIEDSPTTEELHLDEHQCKSCGRSFWS